MTDEQLDLLTLLPDTDDCHTCGQPATVRLHTETNLLLRHAARHWPGHSAGIPLCHDHAGTHGDHPHVPHWVSYVRPLTSGQAPPDWPVLGWGARPARPAPPNCVRPWTFEEPDELQLRGLYGPNSTARQRRPIHAVPITGSYL